jgi:hypothetical protein
MWELWKGQLGEPLLVDTYSKEDYGLRSPSAELTEASGKYRSNPELLWWQMLAAALKTTSGRRPDLQKAFSEIVRNGGQTEEQIIQPLVREVMQSAKRTFLLDGLETAFLPQHVFNYMQGLFKFLQSFEADPALKEHVRFKLFLRTDLAQRGYQNFEQQIAGRVLYLSWDTQTILNFVLSRIPKLPWFNASFPSLVDAITQNRERILQGVLPI